MTALLRAMREIRPTEQRSAVVIPTFTCYSVAASVLKAGLDVLVVDVDPSTLSYEREILETVDFDGVLAVISANLYGIPDDSIYLERLASERGVFMIDDAAQSLGAETSGRATGTFGDAGILSFDKGKVITSINGGVIVTQDSALAKTVEEKLVHAPQQRLSKKGVELAKAIGYSALLNPWLYWIPSGIPQLGLGTTRFDESFEVERYFNAMAPLALAQLSRISELNGHRRECAQFYRSRINRIDSVSEVRPFEDSNSIYLRFPIRVRKPDAREEFLRQFRHLGVSASYPAQLGDVEELKGRIQIQRGTCNGGRQVAQEILTLPTHPFVREKDMAEICQGLVEVSEAHSGS